MEKPKTMDKAEEFFQSKNGGKDSKAATENGELITPSYTVILMEQYATEVSREVAKKQRLQCSGKGNHYIDWIIYPPGSMKTYISQEDVLNTPLITKQNQEESNAKL